MEMLGGEGAVQVLVIHPQLFKHRINLGPSVREGIVPAELLPWGSDFERSTLRLRLLSACYTNYKRCAAKLNHHDEVKTRTGKYPHARCIFGAPSAARRLRLFFGTQFVFPELRQSLCVPARLPKLW